MSQCRSAVFYVGRPRSAINHSNPRPDPVWQLLEFAQELHNNVTEQEPEVHVNVSKDYLAAVRYTRDFLLFGGVLCVMLVLSPRNSQGSKLKKSSHP